MQSILAEHQNEGILEEYLLGRLALLKAALRGIWRVQA